MINLTDSAKQSLDKYLMQVRTALQNCRTVDAYEIEQDITSHIDAELAGAEEPVTFEALEAVLKKLGSPTQWVPDEEISWWRKVVLRLRTGPEDWRLAYICFAMFVVAALFWVYARSFYVADWADSMALVFVAVGFIAARAALSATPNHHLPVAQKWLIYPSLIIAYLLIAFWLLIIPPGTVHAVAQRYAHIEKDMFPWNTGSETAYWTIAIVIIAAVAFLWWFILSVIFKKVPRFFNAVFRPFAQNIRPKHVNWFMTIAAVLFVLCSVILLLMISDGGQFIRSFK